MVHEKLKQIQIAKPNLTTEKYKDYETNQQTRLEMIREWNDTLYRTLSEHHQKTETQQQIFLNIIRELTELYPKDGIPRKELTSFVTHTDDRHLHNKEPQQLSYFFDQLNISNPNEHIHINQDCWAVTLIRTTKNKKTDIIIEGIQTDNQYFMRIAHVKSLEFKQNQHREPQPRPTFGHIDVFKNIQPQALQYTGDNNIRLKSWVGDKQIIFQFMQTITYVEKLGGFHKHL